MKVLIVDDEPSVRESLQEFFESEGFEVATAGDGREALDQLAGDELPAAVILDLFMPVLNGNDVYEAMQKDARLAKVPVVIATSDPSRAPEGAVILKKPLVLDRLLEVVKLATSRTA